MHRDRIPLMRAGDYHQHFSALLATPLAEQGWVQRKGRLFRHAGHSVAALLRSDSKFSSLAQMASYILAFRHDFLRDLEKRQAEPCPDGCCLYPVKIVPSAAMAYVRAGRIAGWRYEPVNLGVRYTDDICYGTDPGQETDRRLQAIQDSLRLFVPLFQDYFTPQEALRQIERFGENAYCEKIWLEDYREFLARAG